MGFAEDLGMMEFHLFGHLWRVAFFIGSMMSVQSAAAGLPQWRCEALFSPHAVIDSPSEMDPMILEDLANLHLDAEEARHSPLADKYRRLLEDSLRTMTNRFGPHLQEPLASRIQSLRSQRLKATRHEETRKQTERKSLTAPVRWETPHLLPLEGILLKALSDEVLLISRRIDPSGNQSEIVRYNVKTQNIEKVWQDPERNKTWALSDPWHSHLISQNGERIYYVRRHHIGFIETKTGIHQEALLPYQKNAQIIHLRLSPDEKSVIAYQSDDDLIVATSDLNLNRYVYRGWHNLHPDEAIDYSPDGRYLLIGDVFNFQIRDLQSQADLFLGNKFDSQPFANGRFSGDSRRLLYIENQGEFSSFDFHTRVVHKPQTAISLSRHSALLPLKNHPWVVGQTPGNATLPSLPILIDYKKGVILSIDYSQFEFFAPSRPVLDEEAGAIFFTDHGVDGRGNPSSYVYRIDLETRAVQQFRRDRDDLEEILTLTHQGQRLFVGTRHHDNPIGFLE